MIHVDNDSRIPAKFLVKIGKDEVTKTTCFLADNDVIRARRMGLNWPRSCVQDADFASIIARCSGDAKLSACHSAQIGH